MPTGYLTAVVIIALYTLLVLRAPRQPVGLARASFLMTHWVNEYPFIALVARPLIDGSYKRTPFFSADTGAPIVTPKVLSPGERERLKSA